MANSLWTMGLSLVVTGMAARHFGPAGIGELSYATAFVSLFTVVATLGIESVAIKHLVSGERNEGTILCTSFLARLIGGFLAGTAATIAVLFIDPSGNNVPSLVMIMSCVMVLKAFDVLEYWLQAHLNARLSSIIRMVAYCATALLKIGVISLDGSIVAYALVYVLDALAVGAALIFAYLRTRKDSTPWRFDPSYAKSVFRLTGPLLLSGLMVSAYSRVDQVMLGAILGNAEEVGIYAAAVTLAEMWYFIPNAIIMSIRPSLFRSRSREYGRYRATMQRLFGAVACTSVLAAAGISVFGHWLVRLVYGEQFDAAALPLAILAWAGVFAMLGVARSVWLLSESLQAYTVIYTSFALLVNVGLNLLLIPRFGPVGAAVATLIAQFANIAILSLFQRTRPSTVLILKGLSPVYMTRSIGDVLAKVRHVP